MSYSIFLRSALGLIFLLSVMASQKGLRHFMTYRIRNRSSFPCFSACPQPAVLPGKPMMNTLNCNSYISPLDCMICASIRQICTLHHTKNQHTTMDHFCYLVQLDRYHSYFSSLTPVAHETVSAQILTDITRTNLTDRKRKEHLHHEFDGL